MDNTPPSSDSLLADLYPHPSLENPDSSSPPLSPPTSQEYHLHRQTPNTHVLIPLSPTTPTCFSITTRSLRTALTRKSPPHITIAQLSAGCTTHDVSSIRFNPAPSPFPYIPRASIAYTSDFSSSPQTPRPSNEEMVQMRNPLSLNWDVKISGVECTWGLVYTPPSLILREKGHEKGVRAVFEYTGYGYRAPAGGRREVGRLRVMGMGDEGRRERVQIVSTLAVVMEHWKSVGKFLMG